MTTSSDLFDAVVIGGGPAGLSAALCLGRSRRRVLLAADGPTRNAPAGAAHNVFTRDGTPPSELGEIGRAQLAPYDVTLRSEVATDIARTEGGFAAMLANGDQVQTRVVVLATGVRDVMPEIPGFAELWGTGVFHCPYCHGWEVAGRPLAIYGTGDSAVFLATLIRGWSDDLVLFTDGPSRLSDEDRDQIARNGIGIREERIERLAGDAGHLAAVVLAGEETVARHGLFFHPRQEQRSDLYERVGCALTDEGRVEADAFGQTAVPGVFVAGDMGSNVQSVASAAASGTTAGGAANMYMLTQEFERGAAV